MKSKKKLILKTFATLFYTLSVICICAGIVGITSTRNNSFESKKIVNKNEKLLARLMKKERDKFLLISGIN